ncbi:MAG: hypothetical protein KDA81_13635 [Planctomycetaceae bacterium]|nr:hypothetical protein [Planctomycetaceae bacterium]
MKKMLMLGGYGLVILGISAGGTWYLRSQELAKQMAEENVPDTLTPSAESLATPVDMTQPVPPEREKELPVAVRPGEMSVEEIVRYGLGLKSREASIREREEALQQTEARHRLVLADIDGEQKEIEGLVAQARDQRTATEQLLAMAQKERLQTEQLLRDLNDQQKKADVERERSDKAGSSGSVPDLQVDRAANVKKFSDVVAGLSPEVASKMMREFANDGKIDMAAEILSTLEERKAAAILDAMNDEKLVAEFAEKFLELRTKVKVAKQR